MWATDSLRGMWATAPEWERGDVCMIFLQLQKEPLQKDKADAEDPAPPVPLKREVDNKGRGRKARATAGTVTHAGPVAWDVVLANTAFLFALVLVDPDKPDGDEPIPKDEDDAADDHNLAGDNADDDDEEAADSARRRKFGNDDLNADQDLEMPAACAQLAQDAQKLPLSKYAVSSWRQSQPCTSLGRPLELTSGAPGEHITENCSGTFSCTKSALSFSAAAGRQGRWGESVEGAGAAAAAAAAAKATARTKRAVAGGGERTAAYT